MYYACPKFSDVIDLIEAYNTTTPVTVEDIDNIYLIPASFIPIQIEEDEGYIDLTFALSQSGGFHHPIELEDSFNKPSSIDGYTPKNNKLLTREFNYLVVSNEVGRY